jgi:2-polyprenyl-6-methoxyphenol hydroxylase-like FAD-dependent oxidoreductase
MFKPADAFQMAEPQSYDTDVLIVGAGPVGLTLANDLSAGGIAFRIIDAARRTNVTRATMAITLAQPHISMLAHEAQQTSEADITGRRRSGTHQLLANSNSAVKS